MNGELLAKYRELAAWLKEDADESSMLTEENVKRVFLAANALPDMLIEIDRLKKVIDIRDHTIEQMKKSQVGNDWR